MGEIAKKNEILPEFSAELIITKAIEQGVHVETLERLLAMRKELTQEKAAADYLRALSGFQSECPIINKTKEVKDKSGKVRYRYAPLDDIIKQVSPLLQTHGLSYSINAKQENDFIIAECSIHHINGHSETSSFPIPIDKDAYMNDAQKSASALTFAKRYAFCNSLGILTGDQDDDGQALGGGTTPQELYARYRKMTDAILENYESIMAIKTAITEENIEYLAEVYAELDSETLQALWVAPSKGGPFTTEERKALRTNEFVALVKQHREDHEA